MSTRFVKKGNKVILGMAKNGSQAIKQLSFNNKDWVRTESDIPEEILIDYKVTIYIPIRDELDRAISMLLQELRDQVEKQNIKDIHKFVLNEMVPDNSYYPSVSYKNIFSISYFWEHIFLNSKWKGAKIKFFNLSELSKSFCEHIQEDKINIPQYNTAHTTPIKVEIMKYLPSKELLFENYFHPHWKQPYQFMEKPIWKRLKSTDYWLVFEDKFLI